ncbi:MAG: TIGR01459 family HAD-type hydrolase [Mangrovicoccus sp.]|nr:TIGR01459 family HAD-type hydrolase [Mangrovicoccus sp.]
MSKVISSLSEIASNYDAVLCDLWGCLHNGVQVFPEAVAALQAYRAGGGTVMLLTNSPRPKDKVVTQLDGLGAPRDCYDGVTTSGDSAQAALMAGVVGRKVYHIGPERDLHFFTDLAEDLRDAAPVERVPLDQAEGIVCTGLFDDETEKPEDYRASFLSAKARGLDFLCANPDVVVDRGHKRIFCAGALAQLYTDMGGQSLYFGKPHAPIYELALRRLAALRDVPRDRILAIGDGPATDVAGGLGEGFDTLFVTGGLAAAETGTLPGGQPDPDQLKAYLAAQKLAPSHAIGQLR